MSQVYYEKSQLSLGMATLEELMPNLINAHEVFEQTKLVEVRQEVSVFFYIMTLVHKLVLKVEVTNTFFPRVNCC